MQPGQWIKLHALWTLLEEWRSNDAVFLRIDDRALQQTGVTYHQALEILEAAKDSGSPLPSSTRAGDAYHVLQIRPDESRQVIRIRASWVRSAKTSNR